MDEVNNGVKETVDNCEFVLELNIVKTEDYRVVCVDFSIVPAIMFI